MHEEQREALVVGGGPAGLAAAIELADQGIEPLVLERRPGRSGHPRSTSVSATAMQLMWQWGIADEVSRQGFPAEAAVSVRTSMTAPERQRVPLAEQVWNCAQDRLAEILSVRALAAGAEIRYGTSLIGLRPAPGGLAATTATADAVAGDIRASYVVGADGARSVVRQSCGIGTSPSRPREDWLSIVFRAPLRDYLSDPPFMLYQVDQPAGAGSTLEPADKGNRWIQNVQWHPEHGESLTDFDASRCSGLVRAAAGIADLPVQVLGVQTFQLASLVADQVRAGRALLAGDAARAHPCACAGHGLALQDGAAAAAAVGRALGAGDQPAGLAGYEPQGWRPATAARARAVVGH
jgi:putative polyketide hydroxylase